MTVYIEMLTSQKVIKLEDQIAICDTCGEKLEYKHGFAIEHRKKYPSHRSYRTELK
jgi:hypothetical protein